MWHRWPSEPGSHTELWGRLACRLSTAEENNWWHFAHSPERYLTVTGHGSCSSNQWCHPEGFWEGSWQRGVAGLGRWHSRPHRLPFKGHHWCPLDNKHPAHWTCEVICTSCSPHCAGLGVQTILSWGDEHRYCLMCHFILEKTKATVWSRRFNQTHQLLWCFHIALFIQGRFTEHRCCFFRNALPHTHAIIITSGSCQVIPQPQPYL